jgi:outer membrane immunogenic protein
MTPYLRYLLSTVSTLTPISASLAQAPAAGSWAGPYVGLNVSATRHKADFDGHDAVADRSTGTISKTGTTFGIQLGYNWQSQNLVYGIEGDWSSTGKKVTGTTRLNSLVDEPFSAKLSHLGTIRGRVGTLLSPSTLVYATGGYARGKTETDAAPGVGGFSDHGSRSGWTIGAGAEHMFAPQWTVKAELLYVDLGTSTVSNSFGSGYSGRFKDTAVVGRVGANFRF